MAYIVLLTHSLTQTLICHSLCNVIIFVLLIHMQMTGRYKSTDHVTGPVSGRQASAAAVVLHQWHGDVIIQLLQQNWWRHVVWCASCTAQPPSPTTPWFSLDWREKFPLTRRRVGIFLKALSFPTDAKDVSQHYRHLGLYWIRQTTARPDSTTIIAFN